MKVNWDESEMFFDYFGQNYIHRFLLLLLNVTTQTRIKEKTQSINFAETIIIKGKKAKTHKYIRYVKCGIEQLHLDIHLTAAPVAQCIWSIDA